MPRIRPVTLDGLTLKISPFTYDEAEQYIKSGQEMIKRQKESTEAAPAPTQDDWVRRTFETVCFALNKAAGTQEWTVERMKAELDGGTINNLHAELMDMCGFILKKDGPGAGEAAATSTGS